jgi:ribokinase
VLADQTERTMITDRGANLRLSPADVAAALKSAPDAVHLHLSGYALLDEASRPAARYALTAAAEQGLTTSVDAASAGPLRQIGGDSFLRWVRGADVLFANEDEALALLGAEAGSGLVSGPASGAELARALAMWVGVAVVKLGAVGAVSAGSGERGVMGDVGFASVEAVPAEALDATGAGDAFAAGYLAAWLNGARGGEALAAAAAMGARAVARIGARPPRP